MEDKNLIKAFEKYTIDNGVAVKLSEDEAVAGFTFELTETRVNFYIIFEEGETDVQIVARDFIEIPEECSHLGEHYANMFNQEYRWAKFAYNEKKGGLIAEHDIDVENSENVNKILDMVYQMCNIIDLVYAELLEEFERESLNKEMEIFNNLFSNNKVRNVIERDEEYEEYENVGEAVSLDEMLKSAKNSAQYA